MYRLISILLMVGIFACITAQELSFKEIDSKTYELFLGERWKELIEFGESLDEESINYYYHNVRMGVAYFNTGEYYSAEKYLLKALANNNIDYPKQYLVWTYLWLGDKIKADQYYDQLSEETKASMDYKKKAIEYVYVEGGTKTSSTEGLSNVIYGQVALGHRFFNNNRLHHSFSIYNQSQSALTFNHSQYSLKAQFAQKQGVLGFGGVIGSTSEGQQFPGSLEVVTMTKQTSIGFFGDYTKRFNRLIANLNLNYLSTKTDSLYRTVPPPSDPNMPDPTPIPLNTTHYRHTMLSSLSLYYMPQVFDDHIGIGLDNYLIFDPEGVNFTVKPFVDLFFTKKVWLNVSYIPIGNYTFWDKTTNRLYNDAKYSNNRFSTTLNFFLFSKTKVNLTYMFENITDRNTNDQSNINSIYLGIAYNF